MSNQSLRQASVRLATETELTYEGDWHALFDLNDIDEGEFNERLLAWINLALESEYTNLPDAQAAFAIENDAASWNELGTFDAEIE